MQQGIYIWLWVIQRNISLQSIQYFLSSFGIWLWFLSESNKTCIISWYRKVHTQYQFCRLVIYWEMSVWQGQKLITENIRLPSWDYESTGEDLWILLCRRTFEWWTGRWICKKLWWILSGGRRGFTYKEKNTRTVLHWQ